MSESVVFPNFIGIGGKKCATTWLAQCLRNHPDIFLSTPKELNFFDGTRDIDGKLDKYLAHFQGAVDHRAIGEFSTTYISEPAAAKEIARVLGNVKIVASLRNPIDRFLSDYTQSVLREQRLGESSKANFDGAASIDIEMLDELKRRLPVVLNNGKYYPGLSEFIRVFGGDLVLVLVKEEIDENPERALIKLYRFLDVDSDYVPPTLHRRVSPGIVPRSVFLERMRSQTFLYCHRRAPFVIDWVRKLRVGELYRRFNASSRAAVELQTEAKAALREYYAEDVRKVQELLGRRIGAWGDDFNCPHGSVRRR